MAIAKLAAGVVGNSYALVADAVESTTDVFSSLVVWGGLRVASRDPDEDYPFGYGKAEALAGAVVALMLLGAAAIIAIEAAREMRLPHHAPAVWTLPVLVAVVTIKWLMSRRVHSVGISIDSTAVKADAWHHMSDAVTSAAAFVGISIALWAGPGWESADEWAAIAASAVIAANGASLLWPATHDLMDRAPGGGVIERLREAATSVPGVRAIEKLAVRKMGLSYRVTLHVQADGALPLSAAHGLGGRVKSEIRSAVPQVQYVLVHMEPYEPDGDAAMRIEDSELRIEN